MSQSPAPTVGRIVHYRLSETDAERINRRREDAVTHRPTRVADGAVVHTGNTARAGATVALVVTAYHPAVNPTINGQALLDGNDSYWVTSAFEGDEPGQWSWPPRV